MPTHPLKLTSLASLAGLALAQLSLAWLLEGDYAVMIAFGLALPLLLPLKGLLVDRRYTYKWVGFLTLVYFAIGISESFSNPQLRGYAVATLVCSCLLFVSSIYYSRYLRRG